MVLYSKSAGCGKKDFAVERVLWPLYMFVCGKEVRHHEAHHPPERIHACMPALAERSIPPPMS